MAVNADLEVIRCEETNKAFCYDSKEDFIQWVISVLGPYGLKAVFEGEQLKSFVADTVDLYCERYNPGKNGKIEYHLTGLHLTAHKESKS